MPFHFINIKNASVVCTALFLLQIHQAWAQVIYQLPPGQPEQDACHALQLCGNTFFTPYSYTGHGNVLDLDESPCKAAPNGGEQNSVWLKIQVAQAGTIEFTIQPVDPQDDYDFAVINATNKPCGPFTRADVLRCNYNLNTPGSNKNGSIGLRDSSRTPYIIAGTYGGSYAQAVYAKSDETYLIMVNNNGNYSAGGASKGFTINFNGSTAIFDTAPPSGLSSIDVPCNNAKNIIIKTTTDILSSSIAADGSDFTTNAPEAIIGASCINASSHGGYSNLISINFSTVIPPGSYVLNVKQGSDHNSLLDLCGNELSAAAASLPFIVKTNAKEVIDNKSICYEQLPYTWNGITVNNGGDSVAKYIIHSTEGCDSTTFLNLRVSSPPIQVNISKTICDGDSYVLPWDSAVTDEGTYVHHYPNSNGCDSLVESVDVTVFTPPSGNVQQRDSTFQTGFCQHGSLRITPPEPFVTYTWNTGETTSSIVVTVAGVYALVALDQWGCTTIDTFVVAAFQFPTANFANTKNLCKDGSFTLDAGPGGVSYLWDNGSTNETRTINTPGQYWVQLTIEHGCQSTDSVTVVSVLPPSNFLSEHITKCMNKEVTLMPSENFSAYKWSNGSTAANITVLDGGLYWLDATDINGCIGRDSINVVDSMCPVYFYIPSAFTPNGDGLNDIFRPTFAGSLSGYHLSIYNRWGSIVFDSKNPSDGWNGTSKGYDQPIGVYIWICSYSLDGKAIKREKGTVTLLR